MNEVVAVNGSAAGNSLMALIARAAEDSSINVDKLRELLAVKKEWEADEARKAYHRAFAAFKAEAVQIVRSKLYTDGPLKGKRYADLYAVVDAITSGLSKHGLSHSWITTKNDKDWIEVACVLTHELGHNERREFGGPPDSGGAKNPIQARASTLSYLQRYTLLMAVGMAATDQDNDGRGGDHEEAEEWPDDLLAAGAAAAEKGVEAYADWWKKVPMAFRMKQKDSRQHADFKAKAMEHA